MAKELRPWKPLKRLASLEDDLSGYHIPAVRNLSIGKNHRDEGVPHLQQSLNENGIFLCGQSWVNDGLDEEVPCLFSW